ncbi:ankyrin repeat domain-containing protein [Flavobacterium sp. HJSW_4]|uniref:ankyrin repeat domain-containing protein n=1 Tax=Flavobacterium sp. HJSW_4 TaxID=3344660 RepID=UPI0035F33349
MKTKYIVMLLVTISLLTSCKDSHSADTIISTDNNVASEQDSKNSDINAYIENVDGFEYTKLGLNCKNNNLKKVEDLISNGADIRIAKKNDIYEYDALYVAIENKNLKIVKLLLNKKSEINQVYDEEGLTPLVLACKLNDIETVKELLRNGADVNGVKLAETDYSLTPLLVATENGNLNLVKLLLDGGADKNLTDRRGNSLKDVASKKGEEWKKIFESDDVSLDKSFIGSYHFEAVNRDNAKTSFDINIKSIDNIAININDDGSKENYLNVRGEKISDNKIKVVYNKTYEDEMGIIFLEKRGDYFYISGNPIYFINPGNKEYEIKKNK